MFLTAIVLSALLLAGTPQGSPAQRIVAASNVRLRSAPQADAEEITRFPLGTILNQVDSAPTGQWLHVAASNGETGWIFTNLTEPFSKRTSVDVYRRIIQARLKTKPLIFPDAADLFDFVDRVAVEVEGPQHAEFEFFRLLALDRSLDQLTRYEPKDPIQQDWLKQHEDDLIYSEPGGQWLVVAQRYWELETKYRGMPLAEEIAWAGVTTGLAGECEGYLPCYMAVFLMSDAQYLDLYPKGAHAPEALDRIDYLLQEAIKPNNPFSIEKGDGPKLRESIASMKRILEKTSSPKKSEMIGRLAQIESTYR